MNARDKDINNILKHYVNRRTQDEIEFIKEQTKSGINVCDVISHQRSCDGKDELIVETQLSLTNTSSESSGNRACTVIKADNASREQSRSSLSGSNEYYIKELRVAHVGKSKSLDDSQMNEVSVADIHETHLTTVVGTKHRPYETVFKAVIEHSKSGRQLLQQNSFVRDTTGTTSSSYHSLPGRILNSVSLPHANHVSRKKQIKIKSWRSIFTGHKKTKRSHVDLSNIDQLAKERILETKEVKLEYKVLGSPSFLQGEVPFKSYKIGEPLQSMKKKKRIPYFLRNILSPGQSLPRTGIWTDKRHGDNVSDGRSSLKEYSTKELGQMPVRRIVATLSKSQDEEDFSYSINGESNRVDTIVPRNRHKSGPTNTTKFHFDMAVPTGDSAMRRKSFPDRPCGCDVRRLELMSRGMNSVIYNTSTDALLREMEEFDKNTFHFKGCPFNCVEFSLKTESGTSSSTQSRLSLYQSCEYCNNVDDQLHPSISVHLLTLITKLEDSDQINFNEDHLRYFLSVSCYKQFEEGIKQAIGLKCSLRNLAYLHYVTRKIVRHIGDPNEGDNEQIRRIMHYAEKFCSEHYNRHIEVHGSVEEFLKNCSQDDID